MTAIEKVYQIRKIISIWRIVLYIHCNFLNDNFGLFFYSIILKEYSCFTETKKVWYPEKKKSLYFQKELEEEGGILHV